MFLRIQVPRQLCSILMPTRRELSTLTTRCRHCHWPERTSTRFRSPESRYFCMKLIPDRVKSLHASCMRHMAPIALQTASPTLELECRCPSPFVLSRPSNIFVWDVQPHGKSPSTLSKRDSSISLGPSAQTIRPAVVHVFGSSVANSENTR
jgi:hypothetical protein